MHNQRSGTDPRYQPSCGTLVRTPVVVSGETRSNAKSGGVDDYVGPSEQALGLRDVNFSVLRSTVDNLIGAKGSSQMAAHKAICPHDCYKWSSRHEIVREWRRTARHRADKTVNPP